MVNSLDEYLKEVNDGYGEQKVEERLPEKPP